MRGSNEQSQGYSRFAKAQYYDNLTKEQVGGFSNRRNAPNMFNASAGALEPNANLALLKQRMWVVNYYKTLHGLEHTFWPHHVMKKTGVHLNKFKFNYAAKGFVALTLISEI
jgi:hypothetical protein